MSAHGLNCQLVGECFFDAESLLSWKPYGPQLMWPTNFQSMPQVKPFIDGGLPAASVLQVKRGTSCILAKVAVKRGILELMNYKETDLLSKL